MTLRNQVRAGFSKNKFGIVPYFTYLCIMWTIIRTFKMDFGGSKRTVADVMCDCGKVEVRRLDHVKSGRTKSCKSCASKNTAKNHPPPTVYKGEGDLSATLFSHYRRGAEKRGIPFNVSIGYLWKLYEDQHRCCRYSGEYISLSRKARNGAPLWKEITASLDRIDSRKPYEPGNVQWVHKDVNNMKMSLCEDRFIQLCHKIVEYN